MLNNFQKRFKAQLKSHDDIITFYKQLRAQGKSCNIHLIDIKNVSSGKDICPEHVPHASREEMALAIFQKLQDVDIGGMTYPVLQNQLKQHSTTCDGFTVLKQLLRHVHPNPKEGDKITTLPKLSDCNNDLYIYNNVMNDYFTHELINNRTYKEKHKSLLYLQNIDDDRYKDAVTQCKIDLGIATLDDENIIKKENLTFGSLPTTVAQLAKTDGFNPIIRAMTVADERPRTRSRGAYQQQKRYEPFQCKGCGIWGHKLNACKTIPKIALAVKFIEKYKDKTEVLIKEFLRTNDRNTKKQTVRILMDTGTLDATIDPQQFLEQEDIPIDMMAVSFDDEEE